MPKEIKFNSYLSRHLTTLGLFGTYNAFEVFKRRFGDSLYNIGQGGNTSAYIANANKVSENYVRGHLRVMFKRGWIEWIPGGLLFKSIDRLIAIEGTMKFIREEHGVVKVFKGSGIGLADKRSLVRSKMRPHHVLKEVFSDEAPASDTNQVYSLFERVTTCHRTKDLCSKLMSLEDHRDEIMSAFLPSYAPAKKERFVNDVFNSRKIESIRKSRRMYKEGFHKYSVEVLDRENIKTALLSVILSNQIYSMSVSEVTGTNRSRRPLVDKKGAKRSAPLISQEVLSGSDVMCKGFSQGGISLSKVFCCTPSKALRHMRNFEKLGLLRTTRETIVLAGADPSPEQRNEQGGLKGGIYRYKGKLYERKVNMYTVEDSLKKTSLTQCKKNLLEVEKKIKQHVCYSI